MKHKKIDIACITESWLNNDIVSNVVDVPGYVMYRHDREDGRRGGGVLCYVRDNLACSHLVELECSEVESLWLL